MHKRGWNNIEKKLLITTNSNSKSRLASSYSSQLRKSSGTRNTRRKKSQQAWFLEGAASGRPILQDPKVKQLSTDSWPCRVPNNRLLRFAGWEASIFCLGEARGHCDSRYVGRTTQRLQKRIKQHVPKAIRQKTTLTQNQGTHRSQSIRTQPNRKCKAKSKTQFKPESDSAIGQHLLESNQCARNYSDSQFKILTTAYSQFHLSLLEAVYNSRTKTDLCRQKQFVFTLQLFQ